MPAIGETFKIKLFAKWIAPKAPTECVTDSFLKQDMTKFLWNFKSTLNNSDATPES